MEVSQIVALLDSGMLPATAYFDARQAIIGTVESEQEVVLFDRKVVGDVRIVSCRQDSGIHFLVGEAILDGAKFLVARTSDRCLWVAYSADVIAETEFERLRDSHRKSMKQYFSWEIGGRA